MRYYTTQHVPGTFLTFEQRQTLASDWNAIVRAGCRVTLRQGVFWWKPNIDYRVHDLLDEPGNEGLVTRNAKDFKSLFPDLAIFEP